MANIRRGDIYYADLRPVLGSEQGGVRPVLILQNDIGNKYSPTTIIAALSSQIKPTLPVHVMIHKNIKNGLVSDSVVLLEQLRTIDKERIKERIGHVDDRDMNRILEALRVSIAI